MNWTYTVNVGGKSFLAETNTYQYDNNGNRTLKKKVKHGQETSPQQTTYNYDFANQLKNIQYQNVPGSLGTDTFGYDGNGLRIKATRNNGYGNYSTQVYFYDRSKVLLEGEDFGTAVGFSAQYTQGLDLNGGIGSLISQRTVMPQYYLHNDLGSIANLTTPAGVIANNYDYDAYGNLLTPLASTDVNRYLFSGKEFESHSGLYYFGARYYDPEIGRWLTPDPLGFVDGSNLYAYVRNSPLVLIDPFGFSSERLINKATPEKVLGFFGRIANATGDKDTSFLFKTAGNSLKTDGPWSLAGSITFGKLGFVYGGQWGAQLFLNATIVTWQPELWGPAVEVGYAVGAVVGGTAGAIVGGWLGAHADDPQSGELY